MLHTKINNYTCTLYTVKKEQKSLQTLVNTWIWYFHNNAKSLYAGVLP